MVADIGDDESISLFEENPLFEESSSASWLKWVALKLQQPFYSVSETTLHAYASASYCKENSKVYVYGVRALGTASMLLLTPAALIGSGLYMVSDKISQKSFTYLKGTAEESPPSDPLTILTLNACMFAGGLPYFLGGLPPSSERLDKLATLVKNQDPQVLLLQEMSYPASVALYEKLKDHYPHFFLRIGPNDPLMESGLFVASKTPIKDAGFILFDGQTSMSRGAFWIETPEAAIFTSHMEHGEENNQMRVAQLGKIKEKMEDFHKPCYLLGDLNIDRYLEGHYDECNIEQDFIDPLPEGTPTCSANLEAVMRGSDPPEQKDEQDDYALLKKAEHSGDIALEVKVIETYEEDKPYEAITDHKGLLLTARKNP